MTGMSDTSSKSVELHKKFQGKLEVNSRIPVKNRADLSVVYTPGVAEPSRVIAQDPKQSFDLTWRGRTVAVVSDGSAVLGLGNIGPEAALPVMEGKSILLKEFGGVDAIPLVINTQDTEEIIRFVRQVAPSFAGINLEDIAAPRCFEVENALQDLGIPVFHDDQHGTAVAVTAALQSAAKVVSKDFTDLKVTILGAGAAGIATAKMLLGIECDSETCTKQSSSDMQVADVILVDSKGIISTDRDDLNSHKSVIARYSNVDGLTGSAEDALRGRDVVIGVSGPNTISPEMVKSMADNAIVFAMANPTPEIMPDVAREAGAAVVATGRSDFANQINNVLVFPGIFRAVIDGRLDRITLEDKQAAVKALADMVTNPGPENIIPDPFTPGLAETVAKAILQNRQSAS